MKLPFIPKEMDVWGTHSALWYLCYLHGIVLERECNISCGVLPIGGLVFDRSDLPHISRVQEGAPAKSKSWLILQERMCLIVPIIFSSPPPAFNSLLLSAHLLQSCLLCWGDAVHNKTPHQFSGHKGSSGRIQKQSEPDLGWTGHLKIPKHHFCSRLSCICSISQKNICEENDFISRNFS